MKRKLSRNRLLSVVYPFIAILIVTVAFTAQAQMQDGGQRFANRAVVSEQQNPSAVWQAPQHQSLPRGANAGRTPVSRLRAKRQSTRPMGESQPVSKFAYVADSDVGMVTGYTIDSATGTLTEMAGSPFPAGAWPRSVSADPQGRFLYVANTDSSNVSAYAIDETTGALTEIPGSPFAAGFQAAAVIVDPSGRFVYVGNQYYGTISAYTADPATGALTEVAGSPFASAGAVVGVTVAPSGKLLYVANFDGSVGAYAIDAVSGALREIRGSPFTAGYGVFQVAVTPSGQFAYAAVQFANSVFAYSINSRGALTQIPGSPFPAGSWPYFVTVDPSGRFVYTANLYSNDVSGYTIDPATGALTEMAGSPFPAGQGKHPGSVTTDLSGTFLYVADWSEDHTSASGFVIDPSTGALSPVSGSPFTGEPSISVTTVWGSAVQSTATTLASSLNPSAYGQAVTFTATVSAASGTPTGTVIFYDGSTQLRSATLANGSASISTSSLSAGSHSITAVYQGSGVFGSSTSAPLNQAVSTKSKTVVATSGSPSFVGQPVTFTATVTSNHGTIPDGELVMFYDGTTAIGTGATASGVATFTTSSLTAKTHVIKATYGGDEVFKPSTGSVKQVVNKCPTTTALSSSPNPSAYKQAVTFTATVTPTGPSMPTGKVLFKDGTLGIGSATLSGGVAKLTKSTLAVGTHPITAEYLGDAASAQSISSVLDQVVQ